jgi:hypothetical protein
MAYVLELSPDDKIYLENEGMQTAITALRHGPGQRQQAGSSVYTGKWLTRPCVYQSPQGVVFQVQTEQKEYYIQVAGTSMSMLGGRPSVLGESLQLKEISNSPVSGRKPMLPMKPIKPMPPILSMQPIEIEMGKMDMQMGSSSASTQQFCSQCGAAVKPDDRFCSSCGYRLN